MKKIITILFLFILPYIAKSQGNMFFNKKQSQIISLIKKMKGVEIMEKYPEYIQAVDTIKVTNLIFYFENGLCNKFVTTHQNEKDYDKILNYLDISYQKTNINEWYFNFGQGKDIITLEKKNGYFLVREEFYSSK